MLNSRLIRPVIAGMLAAGTLALPAAAQEMQPHRAVYVATVLEKGKPGGGPPGPYAFERKVPCDGYVMNQRMRLEIERTRGSGEMEQQREMTEGRNGRKLRIEPRSVGNA